MNTVIIVENETMKVKITTDNKNGLRDIKGKMHSICIEADMNTDGFKWKPRALYLDKAHDLKKEIARCKAKNLPELAGLYEIIGAYLTR